jgi:hypothetical protein
VAKLPLILAAAACAAFAVTLVLTEIATGNCQNGTEWLYPLMLVPAAFAGAAFMSGWPGEWWIRAIGASILALLVGGATFLGLVLVAVNSSSCD